MDIILNDVVLKRRLTAYTYGAAPAAMKDDLLALLDTAVLGDLNVKVGPFLYAHYDLLDDEGKTICALYFSYARAMNWTTYNEKNQSDLVVLAVRRDLGEPGEFPAAADDPNPDASLRADHFNWKMPDGDPALQAPALPLPPA